ncbi:MAG: EamA family transporter [Anaerolineales bacterium]|nr:EamA family transporter [Anaerolineae bacterium]PWB75704.1 MAG: EamA family transporter [Anaerolineales bacterium]
MDNRPARLTLAAFVISTVLGGGNAIAVRFSNLELPPFFGAAIRFTAASLLLFLFVFYRRLPMPKGRALLGVLIFGTLQFGISYALIYWSLLEVPAGLFQVILALTPLLTFFFAVLHRQETFQWQILFGGILAVAGIAIIFRNSLSAEVPLISLLAVVLTAACFAEAIVLFKTFPKAHPVTTNAFAMGTGAVILFIGSWIAQETLIAPRLPETWMAVGYLVLFGSVGAFVLGLYVLSHWTASAGSYLLVLMPIVTILLAAWISHEKITATLLIGGVLVLVGVYVGALIPPDLFKGTG